MWLKRLNSSAPGLHRHIHRASHHTLWVCVLLGMFYLLVRLAFPLLAHYKPGIEARIAGAVGAPVRIRQLTAEWRGIEPELRLNDIEIRDPAHPDRVLLRLPFVKIEPALWQSLRRGSWRLNLRIDGFSGHLHQVGDHWSLRELEPLGASSPDALRKTVHWCLQQAEWQFRETALTVEPIAHPAVSLSAAHLLWRNRGDSHRWRLNALLDGQPFRASADLVFQDPFATVTPEGTVWLSVPRRDWLPWLPALPEGWTLSALQAGGEVWWQQSHGRPSEVTVRVDGMTGEAMHGSSRIRADELRGMLAVRHQDGRWQADVLAGGGRINNQPLPLHRMAAVFSPGLLTVSAGETDLELLGLTALSTGMLPLSSVQWLNQARPQGIVRAFSAEWALPVGASPVLRSASARMERLGVSATGDFPGGRGLSGWFDYRDGQGVASVAVRNGSLDLKQVFREPVATGVLNARISFRHQGGGWLVRSDRVQVTNADADADAVFSFWLPDGDPASAQLQLTASLRNGRMENVWRYVPWPSAGDDTLAWLKQALRRGVVRQGDFLYQGLLVDRPGSQPSLMQMRFALDSAELAYAPGWPALRNLSGDLFIENHRLSVRARRAQVYESLARNVEADIADMEHPVLKVTADIDSTGGDIGRLFRETPLRERAGHMPEQVTVKGEASGRLSLTMPLNDTDKTDVAVDADLPGNPIQLNEAKDVDLWLSGKLHYDSRNGLSSPPMQGFFLTQPVTVSFDSIREQGEILGLQLNVDGQVTPAALRPIVGALTTHARGATHYHAVLTVPTTPDPVHLAVNTDLAGLEVSLPAPLGKPPEQLSPLHLDLQWGNGDDGQSLYLRQGTLYQAQLGLRHGRLTRALVRLGDGRLGDMPPSGVWVSGKLSRLDLDEWLGWLRPQHGAGATDLPLPDLQSFNVQIGALDYAGYRLNDCRLGIEPEQNGWRFQVESQALSGSVSAPGGDRPIRVDIQQLLLPLATSGTQRVETPDWSVPPISIQIARLGLAAHPALGAGRFSARLEPTSQGLRLDGVTLDAPDIKLQGQLDWQWRGQHRTSFSGEAQLGNIANLFSAFDYPQVLNSSKGHAQIAVTWPGAPTEADAARMTGQAKVELSRGRILKLNRTVSLGRLFGVLDSDNFKRRLQLDFSDITQRGLAFDTLSLDGTLGGGGRMDNTFLLISPSVQMRGSGRISLVSGDVSEDFDLTAPLVSAVPYAAAFVAGPLIGGALVAAESVFDDSLKKATSLRYQVRGNWNNPVVERVKRPLFPMRLPLKASTPRKPPSLPGDTP